MTVIASGRLVSGNSAPGEEEDRHDQEVHDQLKALHVLEDRADGGAQRGEDDGDQHHEDESDRDGEPAVRAEAGDQADDEDEHALNDGDGGAAERAADHDLDARHRRDQRFFQEAELAIPEHGRCRRRWT